MSADKFLQKASQAASSARLLLDANDTEGTCNRAYYAMFDASKAALVLAGAPAEFIESKSHAGVLQGFSLYVVKSGLLPADLGRALKRLEELRGAADYTSREIPVEKAKWAVEAAEAFIEAVRSMHL